MKISVNVLRPRKTENQIILLGLASAGIENQKKKNINFDSTNNEIPHIPPPSTQKSTSKKKKKTEEWAEKNQMFKTTTSAWNTCLFWELTTRGHVTTIMFAYILDRLDWRMGKWRWWRPIFGRRMTMMRLLTAAINQVPIGNAKHSRKIGRRLFS